MHPLEGYQGVACSRRTVTAHLRRRVEQQGWKPSANARIALMYLLGKAKSLGGHTSLGRPAVADPLSAAIHRKLLHVLLDTITASILVVNVCDVSAWNISVFGDRVGEADCKDRFNKINPATTSQELTAVSEYLHKAKRWGSK